jgi:hypothetical protein
MEGYLRLLIFTYSQGRDAIPMTLTLQEMAGFKALQGEEMNRTPSGRNWVAVY